MIRCSEKAVLKAGVLFCVAVASLFLSSGSSPAQENRIRAAYSAMSGSMGWFWVANDAGYFEKHGLKVDLIYVGGTALLFQSMLAGEIGFGVGGGPAILNANLQRRSIVAIGGSLNRLLVKIMAASQIRSAADMRGKR